MPDDPMSVFGSGAKKKSRPKKVTVAEAPKAQPEVPPTTTEEELGLMFTKIRERQLELDNKVQEIVNQGQSLPPDLQKLLQGLANWPEAKQEEILSKANQIIEQLNKAIGAGTFAPMEKKEITKDDKRTQKAQKIRGKRNWISMQ